MLASREVPLGADLNPQGSESGSVHCVMPRPRLGHAGQSLGTLGPQRPGSFLSDPAFAFSFLPFREPSLEHFLESLMGGLPQEQR